MADAMKELLGPVRAAVQQYRMIEENDRIAVGLSGGKDSAALLAALSGSIRSPLHSPRLRWIPAWTARKRTSPP